MPHLLQDPPSWNPWPSSTKDAPIPRILPPLSSYLDAHPPQRQSYSISSGPLTPPPTSQMNGNSSRQLPMLQSGQRIDEINYPIRTQVPSINHPAPAYSYSATSSQSNTAQNSVSTMKRSPPPSLSALVLSNPPESKKSPQIAPALKLPSTIRAPQASLPQLAAEVGHNPAQIGEMLTFTGHMSFLVRNWNDSEAN
jgi:hypothetical protein